MPTQGSPTPPLPRQGLAVLLPPPSSQDIFFLCSSFHGVIELKLFLQSRSRHTLLWVIFNTDTVILKIVFKIDECYLFQKLCCWGRTTGCGMRVPTTGPSCSEQRDCLLRFIFNQLLWCGTI